MFYMQCVDVNYVLNNRFNKVPINDKNATSWKFQKEFYDK